jgi:putative inorganic carbon (hco3(-)) transporter
MNAQAITWDERESLLWRIPELLLRPLQLALNFPAALFLATLTIFLFKPPDLNLQHVDRIAFCALCFFVTLRTLALRGRLPFIARFSLPMLALIVLAALRAYRDPFETQNWSLVAGKFIVPFVLFHLAILVFREPNARALFEVFVLLALAYLTSTAIAFLAGARALIFPHFILDETIGLHADRARGPFLQAVANGVSLNLLGLLAVTVTGRVKRRVVVILWIALPWAVLATMTRSVWIGFAASTIALAVRRSKRPVGQACLLIAVAGVFFLVGAGLGSRSLRNALAARTEERGPVDARMAVYQAGWGMIQERPLTGWLADNMYRELARRMRGYRLHQFYVHNTYLALLLEFGWPGLVIYGILFVNLFRLSKAQPAVPELPFISKLRKIWPLLLAVFLFNAFFVDMAYQFVIGLLFMVAGMLCAAPEAARQ